MTVRTPRRMAAAIAVGLATLAPVSALVPSNVAHAAGIQFTAIAPGARGDDVRAVQRALVAAGMMSEDGVDGIYGSGTTAAIKRFQRARGLRPTGTVDDATSIALGLKQSGYYGLKQGSKGSSVSKLQQTLQKLGHRPGAIDGVFGTATTAAVRRFQSSLGYATTGRVNAATAVALEANAKSSSATTTKTATGKTATGKTAAAPADLSKVRVSIGSSGAHVRAAQQVLLDLQYDLVGGADGYYGAMTANAMRRFQQDNKLVVDGIVGPNTAKVLERARQGKVGKAQQASKGSKNVIGLQTGATGSAVKELQQRLLDVGVPLRGSVDGIFGPATARAVRLFQGWHGLVQDGKVGPVTAKALASAKKVDKGGSASSKSNGDLGYARYGETSPRVTALQKKLVAARIALRGGVDGVFGGGTAAAVMSFQRAKGLKVTGVVDAATANKLGLTKADKPSAVTKPQRASKYVKVFPVQGWCGYSNTWGDPRSGGRRHIGTDIIAAKGKLLYAVNDGVIEKIYSETSDRLAGNGVRLRMSDGTYAFYAHMAGLGPGIKVGTRVKAGQVVGTVGSTGNAYTPHLHFEVHPRGGSATNPYPLLKAVDACQVTSPR